MQDDRYQLLLDARAYALAAGESAARAVAAAARRLPLARRRAPRVRLGVHGRGERCDTWMAAAIRGVKKVPSESEFLKK